MKHYNITVSGMVQGVGYRYSAMKMARTYGVTGFIKNQSDGSVYLEVEGHEPNISLFLGWCEKGPGFGRVDRIVKVGSAPRGFNDFSIKH